MKAYIYFFLVIKLAYASSALASARELLRQSQEQFDRGHYSVALSLLSKLDVRQDFDSSEEMIQALKIRAIAFSQTHDLQNARETIRELFFIDPHYQFDPFDTPKLVVELAEAEYSEIAKKNADLALKRPTLQVFETTEKKIDIKAPIFTAFLPFGLNHFYAGSSIKGSVYLSLQAAALLGNIGAFWWKQSYLESFGSSRLLNSADRRYFNAAQLTQYIALSTLLAALSVSIIDAMVGFFEEKN